MKSLGEEIPARHSEGIPNGSILRMDTVTRERILKESNCDPHCHACMRQIEVGDLFGYKRFVTGHEWMLGGPVGVEGLVVRGSACERCIHEDRPIAESEKDEFLARYQLTVRDTRAPEPPPKPPAEPRKGCFILPDGRLI